MDIAALRQEREGWLGWKNIAPLRSRVAELPSIVSQNLDFSDVVKIGTPDEIDEPSRKKIYDLAWQLRPWRKGPFELFGIYIDSEWQSFIKYNLLRAHFDLAGKKVADIGCNNGYYMFRMFADGAERIVGFDPSPLFRTQFDFLNRFARSPIIYELLGVEHLPFYGETFDVIFCLGVLYHRSDPIATLKALKSALETKGELFLDTFIIEGDEEICLCPGKTYSKIPNVYFIPTVRTLLGWCERAGFEKAEVLAIKPTDLSEQRKTEWILGESLGDFLDPADPSKTIEGYPAPKRVYVKASSF